MKIKRAKRINLNFCGDLIVKSLRLDLLVLCNPDNYREYREVIPASRYESR